MINKSHKTHSPNLHTFLQPTDQPAVVKLQTVHHHVRCFPHQRAAACHYLKLTVIITQPQHMHNQGCGVRIRILVQGRSPNILNPTVGV